MAKAQTQTAWVGWGFFGATLLILVGAMQLIQGLGALFNPNYFLVTENAVFVFNITTWGWIHTLIGVIALAGGIGTMAGATWARVIAVIATIFAMLGSIAYITTFPVWATVVLIVGGLVLYALTVHGSELTNRV